MPSRMDTRIDALVSHAAAVTTKYWRALAWLAATAVLVGASVELGTAGSVRACSVARGVVFCELALAGFVVLWLAYAAIVARWARDAVDPQYVAGRDGLTYLPIGLAALAVARPGSGLSAVGLLAGGLALCAILKSLVLVRSWRMRRSDTESAVDAARARFMHWGTVPADRIAAEGYGAPLGDALQKRNVDDELRDALYLRGALRGSLDVSSLLQDGCLDYAVGVSDRYSGSGTLSLSFETGDERRPFFQRRQRTLPVGWNEFRVACPSPQKAVLSWNTTAHSDVYLALRRRSRTRSAAASDAQNVLFIVLDAVVPACLAPYEPSAGTAAIRDFFQSGLVYDNAYAQGEWTLPAAASLALSLYATHHGVHDPDLYSQPMPAHLPTLAELCQQHGCRTLGYVGAHRVVPGYGHARGYDRFIFRSPRFHPETYRLDDMALQAVRQLRENPRDANFVYLHYMDTHEPFFQVPHLRYSEHVSAVNKSVPELRNEKELDAAHVAMVREMYHAKVREVDRSLGLLFEYVDRHAPDTAVILSADHGASYLDPDFSRTGPIRNQDGGRPVLTESRVKVPLLIRPARCGAGPLQRVDDPVEANVGIMPTVLKLLGLPMPGDRDGVDLLSADAAGRRGRGYAISESIYRESYELLVRTRGCEFYGRAARDRVSGRLGRVTARRLAPLPAAQGASAWDERAALAEVRSLLQRGRLPVELLDVETSVPEPLPAGPAP